MKTKTSVAIATMLCECLSVTFASTLAQAADLCRLSTSACTIGAPAEPTDQTISNYNGITKSLPGYVATASFASSLKQSSDYVLRSDFDEQEESDAETFYDRHEYRSGFASEAKEAEREALARCNQERKEFLEAIRACPR